MDINDFTPEQAKAALYVQDAIRETLRCLIGQNLCKSAVYEIREILRQHLEAMKSMGVLDYEEIPIVSVKSDSGNNVTVKLYDAKTHEELEKKVLECLKQFNDSDKK